MGKKLLSVLLSLALCVSLTTPAVAAFSPSLDNMARYGAAAEFLWQNGLFLGSGRSFDLDKPLTRAAGVAMVVRLLGKETEAKTGSYSTPFTDVPAWAAPYVGYSYTIKLTNGVSETAFGPDAPMDAAQFLTLILRALGHNDFTWDMAVDAAMELGLVQSYDLTGDEFFRGQAALIASHALTMRVKGTDKTLGDTIIFPGKPLGIMPSWTADTLRPLKVGVFYYNFADIFTSSIRESMNEQLELLGIDYQNYDASHSQSSQTDQINAAINNGCNVLLVNLVETLSPDAAKSAVDAAKVRGIPILFFNREVPDEVINSYDQCAFVGTDVVDAAHMQGKMIGDYVLTNYDAMDLNKDGKISYALMKGQEGNAEAEARTEFSVRDANTILTTAGWPNLKYFAPENTRYGDHYQVDQNGAWSTHGGFTFMSKNLVSYNEANGNMIELVICNNDGMAEGVVSALQDAGYNLGNGGKSIPVFGIDGTDSVKALISEGKMAGTVTQNAASMAATLCTMLGNLQTSKSLMDSVDAVHGFKVDDESAKIRVPYLTYTGDSKNRYPS